MATYFSRAVLFSSVQVGKQVNAERQWRHFLSRSLSLLFPTIVMSLD